MDKEIQKAYEELGIQFIRGGKTDQVVHAGLFELPTDFPRNELAVEWVPEDMVVNKEQSAPLIGVAAIAPGWKKWKGVDGKQKPIVRFTAKDKGFVLMCRPILLQKAINALYGNVSKERYNTVVSGNGVGDGIGGVTPLQDPGMLPEDRLRESGLGGSSAELDESLMQLNKIPKLEEAAVINT